MWISLHTIGVSKSLNWLYNLFASNYQKNVNLLSTKERSSKKNAKKKRWPASNNAIVGIYLSNFWGVNWVVPCFAHFFRKSKTHTTRPLTLGFQILNIISPGVFGLTIVWESFLGQGVWCPSKVRKSFFGWKKTVEIGDFRDHFVEFFFQWNSWIFKMVKEKRPRKKKQMLFWKQSVWVSTTQVGFQKPI